MIKKGGGNEQHIEVGCSLVIGKYAGVYQQVQGRMYAVKLQIGEGQGVKGRQDRLGVLGH